MLSPIYSIRPFLLIFLRAFFNSESKLAISGYSCDICCLYGVIEETLILSPLIAEIILKTILSNPSKFSLCLDMNVLNNP